MNIGQMIPSIFFDNGYDKDKFMFNPYDINCDYETLKNKFNSKEAVYSYIADGFRFDLKREMSINEIELITVTYYDNDDKRRYQIDKDNHIVEVNALDEFDKALRELEEASAKKTYDNVDININLDDLLSKKERKTCLKNIYNLIKKKQKNTVKMRKDFHLTHNIEIMKHYTKLNSEFDQKNWKESAKLEKDVDKIRLFAIKRFFSELGTDCYREVAINKTYSIGYTFVNGNRGFNNYYRSVIWLFDGELFYKHLKGQEKLSIIYNGNTFKNLSVVEEVYYAMLKKFPLSPKPIECAIEKNTIKVYLTNRLFKGKDNICVLND